MEQVRCTNCGSTAIIPNDSGEFCKCEACGSTFSVSRAAAFSSVRLDRSQDVRAWREYLAKQLRLQQDSSKNRDYGGVKLFAQKILTVLPDDFCAQYYVALSERFSDNDVAFTDFLEHASFDRVTPDEIKEVVSSLVATVEPKYLDVTKKFIERAYPQTSETYAAALDRNVKAYIQRLRYAKATDRDVFICHRTAEPDRDIADAICTRLEERGLRCWIAPRNILAGSQNYERDILKGVENCRLFLLVSSFKSIYSEDCEMELKAAVLAGKALYSYRIDDTPYDGTFEKALSSVQWLDASDDPYAHLEQLVIDVKGVLADDEREKAELEEKRLAAREKQRALDDERRAKEKERIDRLERMVERGAGMAAPASYRSRLRRAEIEVGSENYERAQKVIDDVLDLDPECPLAWWLLMLCDYRIPSDAKLMESGIDFTAHRYFKNAERFAYLDVGFERRLAENVESFRTRTVRAATRELDEAERLFNLDNFNGMGDMLDKCKSVFDDERSVIFDKFPDIASRYFWLRLWHKYGQTQLVCVEDITRESEYKLAVKYASPTQAKAYAKARDTVSQNAQMFLRERSKNRANDGKLVDYLVDNKNILPVEVYNYYSSLMYYRKMLSSLNMTEAQLKSSTMDISTNEYFMLAQSMATVEQKRAYDELTAQLERNRSAKQRRISPQNNPPTPAAPAPTGKKPASGTRMSGFYIIATVFMYVMLFSAVTSLSASGDMDGTGVCLLLGGIARIVSCSVGAKRDGVNYVKATKISLIIGIVVACFSTVFAVVYFDRGGSVLTIVAVVLNVIGLVSEGTLISQKSKK